MRKINKNVPCYGCQKRWATSKDSCHSSCEEYKAYKQAKDAREEIIRHKRSEENMMIDVRVDSIQRVTRTKKTQSARKG